MNCSIYCEKCDHHCNDDNEWKQHITSNIHHLKSESDKKTTKVFCCTICHTKCSGAYDWSRHINSTKHKNNLKNTDDDNAIDKSKNKSFKCNICNKEYGARTSLWYHKKKCDEKSLLYQNDEKTLLQQKDDEIKLQNKKIQALEQTILQSGQKKQPRKNYNEKNVIYMITTEDNEKRGNYIIGKSKNLKNRLSVYNKTSEHKVIFHKGCENEELMDLLERLILEKMKKYREIANRDRFILPPEQKIGFFIDIIKNCIAFLNE